ncbi:hypothetical protein HanHA300_Chr05g0183481 [Helianthus annuus]|nr:hypothetical protein HanHA300_Chr05g0183481 [Helianthus annuus]KAJ0577939.1 hypothetical protein HanIR_Chr05g0241711 [Helianthus annuus]
MMVLVPVVVRSDGQWWLVAGVMVLVSYNVGVGGGGISADFDVVPVIFDVVPVIFDV